MSPPGFAAGTCGGDRVRRCRAQKVPDLKVTIEDMIAEEDKVAVRNHWTGTDSATKQRMEFSGIVIWRIANRQILERWAYLESPHAARV